MKLYPLSPLSRTATNIVSISRRLRIDVVTPRSRPLSGIIILANGTPDDYVVAILSYRLDGRKIVRIAKPERANWIAVFDLIPVYLKYQVSRLMMVIDQENEPLDSLFKNIEEKLSRSANLIDIMKNQRLAIYTCKRHEKEFQLIVVVNGLDYYTFKRHTIEDHLPRAAEIFFKIKPSGNDPKDNWRNLRNEERYGVFKKLSEAASLEELFPQQIKGLQNLAYSSNH